LGGKKRLYVFDEFGFVYMRRTWAHGNLSRVSIPELIEGATSRVLNADVLVECEMSGVVLILS